MVGGGSYGGCSKHGIVYQMHHVEFPFVAMCYEECYGVCTKHGIVYPTPIRGHVPAASPSITKRGFPQKLSKKFETRISQQLEKENR